MQCACEFFRTLCFAALNKVNRVNALLNKFVCTIYNNHAELNLMQYFKTKLKLIQCACKFLKTMRKNMLEKKGIYLSF